MIETKSELKEVINERKLSLISDDELRKWSNDLFQESKPLKRRYGIFYLANKLKYIFIFILFVVLNGLFLRLMRLLGFSKVSFFFIIFTLIFWGILFLLYSYFQEYFSFKKEAVDQELFKLYDNLIDLILLQSNLFDEIKNRNTLLFKELEKVRSDNSKLLTKLLKRNVHEPI